jgi:hypothetical protein
VSSRLARSAPDSCALDRSDVGLASASAAKRVAHTLRQGAVLRAGTWVQENGYPWHRDECVLWIFGAFGAF